MKRVLSLILSIVMAVGMVAGMGTIEVSADSGWEDCYREIIDEVARGAESEDYENNADGRYGDGATAISLYFLHDMNSDDIPELIVYNKDIINGGYDTIFFTYDSSKNESVELYEAQEDIGSGNLYKMDNGDVIFGSGVLAICKYVMTENRIEKTNLEIGSRIEEFIGDMDGDTENDEERTKEYEEYSIRYYVAYPYTNGSPDYSGFDDYIAENPSSLTPSYQEPTPTPESAPASQSYDFQFGRDNFHALNSTNYFFNSSEEKDDGYIIGVENKLVQLLSGMSANVVNKIREKKNMPWGGSCYGMSTVAILNKYGGRLDLSQYSDREEGRAENLYDLCDPKDDLNVKGLINYYHLMRQLPDKDRTILTQKKEAENNSEYFLKALYNAAKNSGNTGLAANFEFAWQTIAEDSSYAQVIPGELYIDDENGERITGISVKGHSVVIYGGEIDETTHDLTKKTVDRYGECYIIDVYDPNYDMKQELYITTDFKKAIYHVNLDKGNEYEKVDIVYDGNNDTSTLIPQAVDNSIETLDIVNYEGRDRNVTLTDYEDSSLSTNDNTAFTVNTASGEEYTAYRDGWLSLSKAIPDSYNEDGACNVRFILPQEEGLTVRTEKQDQVYYNMIYSNCSETIDGYNIDTIEFDPDKRISVSGQDMDYRASLTFDDRTPGVDVIIYEVIGENANNITLNERENGVEITGDNLRDIEINMVRDIENEENAAIENSGNNSVYVEENTIYVDTNADGNYTEDEIVYQGEVDSTVSAWAQEQIAQAQSEGLIPSILQGKDLTAPISRAEFAAVAVTMYEKLGGDAIDYSSVLFSDQDEIPNPEDVAKAYALGITNGTDNNMFAPNDNITREDLTTMLCRAVKKNGLDGWTLENDSAYPLDISGVEPYADDADISDYARESVYYMTKIGVVNGMGDNMFMPKASTAGENALIYSMATREQALVMSLRVIENGSNL